MVLMLSGILDRKMYLGHFSQEESALMRARRHDGVSSPIGGRLINLFIFLDLEYSDLSKT